MPVFFMTYNSLALIGYQGLFSIALVYLVNYSNLQAFTRGWRWVEDEDADEYTG